MARAGCHYGIGAPATLHDWWQNSSRWHGFNTLFLLVLWSIWKEQHARLLDAKYTNSQMFLHKKNSQMFY